MHSRARTTPCSREDIVRLVLQEKQTLKRSARKLPPRRLRQRPKVQGERRPIPSLFDRAGLSGGAIRESLFALCLPAAVVSFVKGSSHIGSIMPVDPIPTHTYMESPSRPEFWTKRYVSGETPWDLGRPPAALLGWLARTTGGGRVLIPGVGSGHEIPAFAKAGWNVTAVDMSEAAIERARGRMNGDTSNVTLLCGNFFSVPLEFRTFDAVYERTFLCSLHPARWNRMVARLAALLKPGGLLVGHYFFGETVDGPPFALPPGEDRALFDHEFELIEDTPATDSLPLFEGRERWQVRRRKN